MLAECERMTGLGLDWTASLDGPESVGGAKIVSFWISQLFALYIERMLTPDSDRTS
jgi:hypothetical protein